MNVKSIAHVLVAIVNKSIKIFTYPKGISTHLHWTFPLLCWFFYSETGIVGMISVVVSIFLHEIGHAVIMQKYGGKKISISMNGIGGITRAFIPQYLSNKKEIYISLAGVAMNAALVIVSGLLWLVLPVFQYEILLFMCINAILLLSNILPIYPLDGGDALEGILTSKIGRQRAEDISVIVGVATSAAIILASIKYKIWLLTAIFVILMLVNISQFFVVNEYLIKVFRKNKTITNYLMR